MTLDDMNTTDKNSFCTHTHTHTTCIPHFSCKWNIRPVKFQRKQEKNPYKYLYIHFLCVRKYL